MDNIYLRKKPRFLRLSAILTLVTPLICFAVEEYGVSEKNQPVYGEILSVVFNLFAVISLTGATYYSRRISLRQAIGWGVLALAQFTNLLGDSLFLYDGLVLHTMSFSATTDTIYALFYPLFLAGILVLISEKIKGKDYIKRTLDVCIVLLAVFMFTWVFMFKPIFMLNPGLEYSERFLMIAYPLADVFILYVSIIALYYYSESLPDIPIRVLQINLLVMVVTDFLFCFQRLTGTYTSSKELNIGWWLSSLLTAFAAIYQSMLGFAYPFKFSQNIKWEKFNKKVYEVLSYFSYVAVLSTYLLLIVYSNSPLNVQSELFIGVGLIITLVMIRQSIVVKDNKHYLKYLTTVTEQLKQQAVDLDQTNRELNFEIEKRNRIEEVLSFDAMHDGLTGLSNRVLFMNRLEHAIEKTKREPNLDCSVLFLDLDNFKSINDVLGHSVGDLALIELGNRLNKCIRSIDTLARYGGDEFVILLENTASQNITLTVANRIVAELQKPLIYDNKKVYITCSIGVVQGIQHYNQKEEILRDVDIAMYTAKKNGKSRFEIFSIDMGTAAAHHFEVANELQQAITNKELFLRYQPIFRLDTNKISGFEALLRWQHPLRGILQPDEFISIAEDMGAIDAIGNWVLQTACKQMQDWYLQYPESGSLTMSVNVSGKQVVSNTFVQKVKEIVKKSGLEPSKLKLEVSENTFLMDQESIKKKISSLHNIGIQFSIDDFGTGYSSLINLKNFSINEIKIEKSFSEGITEGKKNLEICRAVILMAQQLGINTVAEGVENREHLKVFKTLNCHCAQGYYLSKPLSATQIESLLMQNKDYFLPYED